MEWRRDFFFVNLAVSCCELFSDHPKIYIGWTGPTNINDGSKFCHSNIGIQNLEPSAPWTPRFLGSKLDLNSNSCRRHWLSWDATIQRCERACRIETIPFVDCIVNLLMDEKCHFETSSFKKRYMSISVYCHAKQTQKQQHLELAKPFATNDFHQPCGPWAQLRRAAEILGSSTRSTSGSANGNGFAEFSWENLFISGEWCAKYFNPKAIRILFDAFC